MHTYRTILATLGNNFLTNLVAYWAFENNANDSLGVHNGTEVGSPTYTTGKNGQAIDFGNDGTLRYVDVADSNDFSFTDGVTDLPFSISLWVNFTSFSSIGNWILNKRGNTSGTDEWQFNYSASTGRIGFAKYSLNNSQSQQVRSDFTPNFNQWYYITVTDGGTGNVADMRMYVDGVLQTTKVNNSYVRMPNGSSIVRLGTNSWNLTINQKHRGLLDEVTIWKNRELTSTEVTKLYNAGAGKFYPF
jgi:hypothetical protein